LIHQTTNTNIQNSLTFDIVAKNHLNMSLNRLWWSDKLLVVNQWVIDRSSQSPIQLQVQLLSLNIYTHRVIVFTYFNLQMTKVDLVSMKQGQLK